MKNPLFLRLNGIVAIHIDQISRYGGSAGIRDMGLFQSPVAMPMGGASRVSTFTPAYEMAAAYLFHLVRNHAFVDGNKRVGTVAALVFLELNGIEVEADEIEFQRLVLDITENKSTKSAGELE